MYKLIKWIVIKWKELWRTIWFRTANIKISEDEGLLEWTYKINWLINWIIYNWVWTFIKDSSLFEWHFFNFNQDIYWNVIEIMILYKIRENKKFNNLDDLKEQIKKDIESVKMKKDYVLTFWTFDITHPWHEYYLKNARLYWDKLVTIVATDENVYKFKWHLPKNNQEIRLENLKNLWISDIAIIWEWIDPLKWIDLYMPKVVCLWYDQKWFSEMLDEYIKEKKLDIQVFRIDSFREDIYKSSKIKLWKI